MTERAHVNVGGDKQQLDAIYTILINLPARVYDQRTQYVEAMAASYRITPQQAYILKLESEKKRRFMQDNNNNNDINDHRARALGNADRRQATRSAEATTRARRLNKTQYFDGILPHHEQYTMKRSFNAYVKKQYCNTLFQNVKRASQQITNIAYRLQLFLLDYTLHYPNDVPPALLSMNGLYSL
ncbi:hypothetical protein, partial, partial [Absidia glauca]